MCRAGDAGSPRTGGRRAGAGALGRVAGPIFEVPAALVEGASQGARSRGNLFFIWSIALGMLIPGIAWNYLGEIEFTVATFVAISTAASRLPSRQQQQLQGRHLLGRIGLIDTTL